VSVQLLVPVTVWDLVQVREGVALVLPLTVGLATILQLAVRVALHDVVSEALRVTVGLQEGWAV